MHASLSASIRVDIVVGLELSVDNINEFTDFDADVVTSLFVVLGTLIQKLGELTHIARHVGLSNLYSVHDALHRGNDAIKMWDGR